MVVNFLCYPITYCNYIRKCIITEPAHDKTNKITCAPSKDSDQPGHPPSLIRVFAVCLKKHWDIGYPRSAQGRLQSDWDQTGRMHRLICVFDGHTCHFVGSVMLGLNWYCFTHTLRNILIIVYWILNLIMGTQRKYDLSCLMTKPTYWYVHPTKTQISLGICPVWSESSLCAQWVAKDPTFLHADSEDSDQTGQMPSLIWVFTGRTVILLVLSWGGSFYIEPISTLKTKVGVKDRKRRYRKFPKYSDTQIICCNHSKIWTMWLYHRVMSPNDAAGMANSVDPDQCRPWSEEQCDLGLHCLPRHICPKT